jgi:hypothetical protein
MLERSSWLVALAIVLAACGSDGSSDTGDGGDGDGDGDGDQGDGDEGDGDGDGDQGDGDGDGDGEQGAVTREALIGRWISGCRQDAANYYGQNEIEFTEDSYWGVYRQYLGDSTCSDESKQVVDFVAEASSWTLGAVTAAGHTEIDMVNAKQEVTLLDASTASAWAGSGCGPFTANEPKEVSGMSCFSYPYPEVGGTSYNVVSLADGVLSFGDTRTSSPLTPETRPTLLDQGEGRTYQKK